MEPFTNEENEKKSHSYLSNWNAESSFPCWQWNHGGPTPLYPTLEPSSSNRTSKFDLAHRIHQVTFDILNAVAEGKTPGINRKGKCTSNFRPNSKSSEMFALQLCVMNVLHETALSNVPYITKREIFYRNPALFQSQSRSDSAIESLAKVWNASRLDLRVIATPRGFIQGPISIQLRDGQILDLNGDPQVLPLAPHIRQVTYMNSVQGNVKAILIIEKAATLTFLNQMKWDCVQHCILMTSCGFPNQNALDLLQLFHMHIFPCTPIYILTDCDPHGFHIALIYMNHLLQGGATALDIFKSRRSVKHIGLLPDHIWPWEDHFHLIPLTIYDIKRARMLLKSSKWPGIDQVKWKQIRYE
jgi:DNA topoisomerase VI subunit A